MKYYEYVDETGQDTAGKLFVVSVVILASQRYQIEKTLEVIEVESRKFKKKWTDTKHSERESYLRKVIKLEGLRETAYFDTLKDSKDYFAFTAKVTADAARQQAKKGDQVTVYVDGFTRNEIAKFTRVLRPSMKVRTVVKMIRRDESSSLIRLVDTICGLIRDAEEGHDWAKALVRSMRKRMILI